MSQNNAQGIADSGGSMRSRLVTTWITIGLIALMLAPASAGRRKDEPDVVVVQHILIGFKKKVPGKTLDRSKKEAEALATELLRRAREGEDFEALITEYTDDTRTGYVVTNDDAPLRARSYERAKLAVYFGDVAFGLEVGEIGMAKYHPGNSPYGWHIIKRLE
jgi:hypothetical protein